MSAPARSVFFFGLWAIIAGWGMLLAPTILLKLVALDVAEPVYVRIIGMILLEVGVLYIVAARVNATFFWPLSVKQRAIPVVVLSILVAAGIGPWQLLLFAAVDGLSAWHTWWVLNRK